MQKTTTQKHVFDTCVAFCLLLTLLTLGACSSEDADNPSATDGDVDTSDGDITDGDLDTEEPDGDDSGEIEEVEVEEEEAEVKLYETLPVAHCGMTEYELIDPAELGQIVDYEEITFWDKDSTSLDSLFATAGVDFLDPVPYGTKLFRYRYTTQDKGVKIEATAMLGIPTMENPESRDFPMVLYTHGTTGFSDPCAPSNPEYFFEGPAIPALMTSLGYVVISPDYIGMNGTGTPATVRHGYLVGEQTAIGSWDAVRAGERLLKEQLGEPVTVQNNVIPWGGSQGGHAAMFSDLFAPYYAPEYDVPAVVAMVVPSNLKPLIEDAVADIRPGTGLLGISLVTMHVWYGRLADLTEVMSDEEPYFFARNAETLIFPEEACEIDIDVDLTNASVDMLFSQNFMEKVANDQWDQLTPWNCFYRENSLLTSSIPRLRNTPTLMVYGEKDDLVVTEPMRIDFADLCADGYQLDYIECAEAGHVDGALWSLPHQITWLQDRLDGKPLDSETSCTVNPAFCCAGSPEDKCGDEE